MSDNVTDVGSTGSGLSAEQIKVILLMAGVKRVYGLPLTYQEEMVEAYEVYGFGCHGCAAPEVQVRETRR